MFYRRRGIARIFRSRDHFEIAYWGEARPGGFPLFWGKVRIMSRTLSGLFLVGALKEIDRPRKRKGTIGKCYACQGLGTFQQGKWLLQNRPRLRERTWIFSYETATAFLSFSECF